MTVNNVAPTLTIRERRHGPEGTQIELRARLVSDPSAIDKPRASRMRGDGTQAGEHTVCSGTAASFRFTPDDNGSYVVTLTATDKDGGIGTQRKTITVTNVAPRGRRSRGPAAAPRGHDDRPERQHHRPRRAGHGRRLHYAWAVTKTGGAYASGTGSDLQASRPTTTPRYVVTLTATDKDGGTGNASRRSPSPTWRPTATITDGARGEPRGDDDQLSAARTDPGSADTAAGFSYAWR